jgi:hypothetical protein
MQEEPLIVGPETKVKCGYCGYGPFTIRTLDKHFRCCVELLALKSSNKAKEEIEAEARRVASKQRAASAKYTKSSRGKETEQRRIAKRKFIKKNGNAPLPVDVSSYLPSNYFLCLLITLFL